MSYRQKLDSKLNLIKSQHSALEIDFSLSRKKLQGKLNEVKKAEHMIQGSFHDVELSLSHLRLIIQRYDEDKTHMSNLVSSLLASNNDLRTEEHDVSVIRRKSHSNS